MFIFEIPNFTRLSETLFTSGQPSEPQLAEIARESVNLVINLALPTSDHALADESATVQALGMKYIHIPVVWENPMPGNLTQFMNAMDAHPAEKILVHCALNYRASAFTALWRVLRQGWDEEIAFAPQRAIWNLEEYPVWKTFVRRALE